MCSVFCCLVIIILGHYIIHPPTVTMIILLVRDVLSNLSTLLFVVYVLPCHCPLAPLYVIITLLRHAFIINKACNVLRGQSEVVVSSCRRLWNSFFAVSVSSWLESDRQLLLY